MMVAFRPTTVQLTMREREVVESLTCGYTADEVAQRLGISTNTVRSHLRAAYAKTGASSLPMFVRKVIRGAADPDVALRAARVGAELLGQIGPESRPEHH